MKIGMKVAGTIGILIVFMLVVNSALRLLNEPNDMAVATGVAILLAGLVCLVAAATRIWKFAKSKIMLLVICMLAATWSTGCNTVVQPGHVGIKVNQSGSDRGVADFPITSGRVWYNPITETVFEYPTSVQRVIWTKSNKEGDSEVNEEINYNSKDELVFHGDFTVSYELIGEKAPHFYVKFRNDDIKQFTHGFFRDQVRDALNETAVLYTADELYGAKKSEFVDKSLERVRSRVAALGINVISMGYASSPRPPDQVAKAINDKIAAIQKGIQIENELAQATAEAKKVVAQAEGTAEANRKVAASITPTIVEWRKMDVQQQAISRWDGKMPTYSGGAMPFLQLPAQK